ncbi:MAG TPA: flagellar hook-associated protein FlgL [Steroidobacteraceae bacterium]|nr:flagellar hook-associated protein FlgL [Steroidobacteraceae bacterium]
MRISTSAIHENALSAMMKQQATLSATQNQIATGKRVQSPADDPVASVHILELQRALQESEQYDANSKTAQSRLNLEEQALADVGNLITQVNEKALQGNNATVDPASRKMIAVEIRQRLSELMEIANRKDANGEYLFAGYSTLTQPFSQTGSSVSYFGDQGSRQLQVSSTAKVSDSHSGYQLFMQVPQGNGTFVTAASSTNTGTGVIGVGSVVNPTAWVPDDYTLSFTSATGDYQIVDSASNVVTTGTYTAGSAISFNGVNIDLTGMPASGDTFTISRSRTEDVFTTLGKLADALEGNGVGSTAQFNSEMGQILQQLDQATNHVLGVRAEVGARLSALDNADSSREEMQVELKTMKSDLQDLDYADAITKMNQQLLGLQAAQASYSKIAQLSLFDYLR